MQSGPSRETTSAWRNTTISTKVFCSNWSRLQLTTKRMINNFRQQHFSRPHCHLEIAVKFERLVQAGDTTMMGFDELLTYFSAIPPCHQLAKSLSTESR